MITAFLFAAIVEPVIVEPVIVHPVVVEPIIAHPEPIVEEPHIAPRVVTPPEEPAFPRSYYVRPIWWPVILGPHTPTMHARFIAACKKVAPQYRTDACKKALQ